MRSTGIRPRTIRNKVTAIPLRHPMSSPTRSSQIYSITRLRCVNRRPANALDGFLTGTQGTLMRRLLLLLSLALGAGVAQADNDSLYVGAGVSRDNLKDIAATNSDLNSTNWKVWAGFRPISVFAVEADYIDLGSQDISSSTQIETNSSTHLGFKAYSAYAVGYLPIPDPILDVFVKAGVARWNSSGSQSTFSPFERPSYSSLSDNGTQFAWGLGAQVHFGHIGARLEYENFDIRNTGGTNIISLSGFLSLL